MANITENSVWESGIYQLETDDPVLGGPVGFDAGSPVIGHANAQAQQLANRSKWLYDNKANTEDLTNTTDPMKGAAIIGRSVVSVKSVEDLLQQARVTNSLFAVRSYYNGGKEGGGLWTWDELSTEPDDYGSVLAVSGVPIGRFRRIKSSPEWSAYEYGVRAENTGLQNRLRLSALYKKLQSTGGHVRLIDEDFFIDASSPIIVPADVSTYGGKGLIKPIFESPQPAESTAPIGGGLYKCYGAVFTTGDTTTGLRFSEANFIRLGTIKWVGVKIRNTELITTSSSNFLHGIFGYGGINIYEDCEIDDMPNNGISTSLFREAHYIRTKCRRNGFLGAGFAKNGISNSGSQNASVFPAADLSKIVTVIGGQYTANKDEGIQYSRTGFVWIEGADCRFNLDRAIEGDSAYSETTKTRPNDQVHIYNNDCRGVAGTTRHSITCTDGFNKDVYLGGNILGNCINEPLIASCTVDGSFVFTSKNIFELDSANLQTNCHAMYIGAGLIDISAGGVIKGVHDRSSLGAVILSANNSMAAGGGVVKFGNFTSEAKFRTVVDAGIYGSLYVDNVDCNVSGTYVTARLKGSGVSSLRIKRCTGSFNSEASSSVGFVNVVGTDTTPLAIMELSDNKPMPSGATSYVIANTRGAAGGISKLFSSSNYWQGYTMPTGSRLTALNGLASTQSALDLPALA